MAIPSGSGTEVLKRNFTTGNSDNWFVAINGVANHIYTVLSIVAHNTSASNDEQLNMRVVDSGANNRGLMSVQQLNRSETFIWNDKLVLVGEDELQVYNTAGSVDWYISYIDQDWT